MADPEVRGLIEKMWRMERLANVEQAHFVDEGLGNESAVNHLTF